MDYGVKNYSPDDGRELGLQGMIDDLVQKSDFPTGEKITFQDLDKIKFEDSKSIAEINFCCWKLFETKPDLVKEIDERAKDSTIPIIGITGAKRCRKVTDELVERFYAQSGEKIAIISIDPSKKTEVVAGHAPVRCTVQTGDEPEIQVS